MININLLYSFMEVAKAGNLTAASLKLAVTQPALSARIRVLEAEIGKSLFLRKKSGMELNNFGKELLSMCTLLNKNFEQINNWINEQRGCVKGTLNISAVSGIMNYVLPHFLEEFAKIYTETKFTVEENVSAVSEECILSGSHDIGIITGKCKKNSLKAQLIMENNDVVMTCTPKYLKQLGDKITSDAIRPDQIIWFKNPRSRATRVVAKDLGISILDSIGKFRLPDMETCKIYALSNLGVAVVSKMFIREELKNGKLCIVPGFKIQIPIYMIFRNETYQSPLMIKFKEAFVKYCRKLESNWSM